jgi:hypothetical protein
MLLSGARLVSRPVKVAPVIEVFVPRIKSSADSISNFPPALSGREAVAILPSGSLVLKKVVSATAGTAGSNPSNARGTMNFA